MKLLFTLWCILFVPIFGFTYVAPSYAADIRTGETVTVSTSSAANTPLKNLYLFGQTISETAPVEGDILSAGNTLMIDGPVSGDIFAAGRTLVISSPVENSLRVAGQDVQIKGRVKNDVIVAGSNVIIDKNASIGGDVIFAGKNLIINAPIGGKLLITGANVNVNAPVHAVTGHVNSLVLGSQAVIDGPLTYTSPQKAQVDPKAIITGKTTFTQKQTTKEETRTQMFKNIDIYKLLIEIFLCVLMVHFFPKRVTAIFTAMQEESFGKGLYGLGFLIFFPIAAFIALILLWLGIAGLLFYGFMLILTQFLAKLFAGWYILTWYEKRSKNTYTLDWKAAIVGPLVLFIIGFVPVVGWLILACVYLVALGSLVKQLQQVFLPIPTTKST